MPMQYASAWKQALIPGVILAILLLIGLPLLNAFGILSDYYLNLFGKYLALAILALGMDLIWGYAGILSLGQAIFFGFGAYAMGMYLMLASSGQGVYGERIPDFMVWNRVTTLPFFWKPFLTQAMAFATWLMCNRNEMNLGGTNGLTDFKSLFGFSLNTPSTLRVLYLATALCLVGSFIVCKWLVGSKMGLVLTAMRDQEQRLRFLGYPIAQYKIFIFALAAALAGLSGALYAPQVGIITPSQIGVLPSLEVVVWVATGGRGTLIGALLGAVGINAARSMLTASYPEWWPIILGGLFVGVVILFPNGLVGIPHQLRQRVRRARTQLFERPAPGSAALQERGRPHLAK